MAIEVNVVSTNPYAPEWANSVNLYTKGEGRDLTLGQLLASVCLGVAAAYESQSVLKMNRMNLGTRQLDTAAGYLTGIVQGTADWTQAKAYLTGELEIPESSLPSDLGTYAKRMTAAKALKEKMDTLAQKQQQAMIDLQTLVNRRDVAFSTSANSIHAMGTSMQSNAANL